MTRAEAPLAIEHDDVGAIHADEAPRDQIAIADCGCSRPWPWPSGTTVAAPSPVAGHSSSVAALIVARVVGDAATWKLSPP